MSITIADCLKLPSLRKAKVVSGHKGLNKIVESVSVLEFMEADVLLGNVFLPNEIVLTAFFCMKDDVTAQVNALELLYRSGDVGIILFYVGHCVPSIDKKLLEKSEELDFPIIVMPENCMSIFYREIIMDIMDAVFRDKQRETSFTHILLERISQFPEHHRTIANTLQVLGERLKCSVYIIGSSFNCLHFFKQTSSNLTFDDLILHAHIEEGDSTVAIEKSEVIEGERVSVYRVPFFAKNFQHLSLIIVNEFGTTSNDEQYCAIEFLQLFSNIWKQPFDKISPDALIPAILGNNTDKANRIADMLKIDISRINTLLIIRPETASINLHEKRIASKKMLANLRKVAATYENMLIADVVEDHLLVGLMAFSADHDNDKNFLAELQQTLEPVCLDFSLTVFTNLMSSQSMPTAFLSYIAHIEKVRIIFPTRNTYSSADIQFATECNHIIDEKDSARYYFDIISPLLAQKDGDSLLETLTVFLLDANNSAKSAGEILFLHKNTIQYRVNKIKRLLNIDFDVFKTPDVYTLYKAVAVDRLFKSKK